MPDKKKGKRELPPALRANADKLKRKEPLTKGDRKNAKKTARKATRRSK